MLISFKKGAELLVDLRWNRRFCMHLKTTEKSVYSTTTTTTAPTRTTTSTTTTTLLLTCLKASSPGSACVNQQKIIFKLNH